MRAPRQPNGRYRRGQAAPILAVFALSLVVATGLAVDSGMLYLGRRQLQNTVDAACLAAAVELSMGSSETDAATTADEYIKDNLDANARGSFELPADVDTLDFTDESEQVGTGATLTHGIEADGDSGDVRVAATLPASTYFMRVAGITQYQVAARARCSADAGGGGALASMAVNRFPAYDQSGKTRLGGADLSRPLPQYYGNGKSLKALQVRDVLQATGASNPQGVLNDGAAASTDCGSTGRNWYNWPTPSDADAQTGAFAPPCVVASPSTPGPEVELLGNGADANIGDKSFRGQVLLDIRQITFPQPLYYNGASSSSTPNSMKDTFAKYLLNQYPGPDVLPGQQLAIMSGVSAGQTTKAISDNFQQGDILTALVYDGTIYRKGGFEMTLSCRPQPLPYVDCAYNATSNPSAKYVYRTAPPADDSSLFNTLCQYSGEHYLAEANYPVSLPNLLPESTKKLYPAKYVIELKQAETPLTIALTARLSGLNPGTGADFGGVQVRWNGGSWQSPNDPFSIGLPANTSVPVTLELIQTATTTRQCLADLLSYTVPEHVYGVHTLQVIGRAQQTSFRTSAYGVVGMYRQNSGDVYDAGDYFLSFAQDPGWTVQGSGTVEAPLAFIDANTNAELGYAELPFDPSTMLPPESNLPGVTANVVDVGGRPYLRVDVPEGTAAGEYHVDVQWNTAQPHSARFIMRVQDPINSSIDSWVVALCYARFELTDVSKPNVILGRAVSGCLDPETDLIPGRVGRMLSW